MAYVSGTDRERKRAANRRARSQASANQDSKKPEEIVTAKLFMHGRSQAVRLPKDFRFPGSEVRVSRFGDGVLLQPLKFDVGAWFKRLDSYGDVPFMPEGREQPEMPPDDEIDFDK